MDKHTKDADHQHKEGEGYKDSLGQENPAQDLQKKTITEVGEINKKAAADAEKAEKSEKH
jgi:hypothetical protein